MHFQSSWISVCMYTCSSQYRDTGRAKEIKKFGTAVNAICHWFGSPWSFIPFTFHGSLQGYRTIWM